MEIQKIFSDIDGDERLYSVLMSEEEYDFYESYFSDILDQREFNKKTKLKEKTARLERNSVMHANRASNRIEGNINSIIESMNKRGISDPTQLTGKYADWFKNDPNLLETVKDRLAGGTSLSEKQAKQLRAAELSAQTGRDVVIGHAKTAKSAVSEQGLNLSGHGGNKAGSYVKVDAARNSEAKLVRGSREGGSKAVVTYIDKDPQAKAAKKARRAKYQREVGATPEQQRVLMTKTKRGRYHKGTTEAKVTAERARKAAQENINEIMGNWSNIPGQSSNITHSGPKSNSISVLSGKNQGIITTGKTSRVSESAGKALENGFLKKNKKLLIGAGIAAGAAGLGAYAYRKQQRSGNYKKA